MNKITVKSSWLMWFLLPKWLGTIILHRTGWVLVKRGWELEGEPKTHDYYWRKEK